jgi:hypothetical protein
MKLFFNDKSDLLVSDAVFKFTRKQGDQMSL